MGIGRGPFLSHSGWLLQRIKYRILVRRRRPVDSYNSFWATKARRILFPPHCTMCSYGHEIYKVRLREDII